MAGEKAKDPDVSGWGEQIIKLYDTFLLRDLLGYIFPGAVLLIGIYRLIFYPCSVQTFVKELGLPYWLTVAMGLSAAYSAGVLLRLLGAWTHLLVIHPVVGLLGDPWNLEEPAKESAKEPADKSPVNKQKKERWRILKYLGGKLEKEKLKNYWAKLKNVWKRFWERAWGSRHEAKVKELYQNLFKREDKKEAVIERENIFLHLSGNLGFALLLVSGIAIIGQLSSTIALIAAVIIIVIAIIIVIGLKVSPVNVIIIITTILIAGVITYRNMIRPLPWSTTFLLLGASEKFFFTPNPPLAAHKLGKLGNRQSGPRADLTPI